MKKILLVVLMVLGLASFANAQSAWSGATVNDLAVKTCTVSLDTSTTLYTSVISFLSISRSTNNKYIGISYSADAQADTVTLQLYGANTTTGTKFLLKSTLIADVIPTLDAGAGLLDINAYPFPYYFIGITTTGNEPATATATVKVIY